MSTEQLSSNTNFVRAVAPSTPVSELVLSTETKQVDPLASDLPAEAPIEFYETKMGRAYLVDLYEMNGVEEQDADAISAIDKYLLAEINERKLTQTKKSYQSLLAELESKLSIDPNLRYDEKVKKLSAYVDVMSKQRQLELTKKLLEHGIK